MYMRVVGKDEEILTHYIVLVIEREAQSDSALDLEYIELTQTHICRVNTYAPFVVHTIAIAHMYWL